MACKTLMEHSMTDLNPCPFCGGGADVHTNPGDVIWAECAECEAQVRGEDELDAIEKWNRRAMACLHGPLPCHSGPCLHYRRCMAADAEEAGQPHAAGVPGDQQ